MTEFDTIRFSLFTRSYSAKLLAEYIIKRSKKNDASLETDILFLAKVLRFKYKDLQEFVLNFSTFDRSLISLPFDTEIFLEVEKEFHRISSESLDSYSLTQDDYRKPTLMAALERIVGDTLAEVDDDSEFQRQLDEGTRQFRYFYYKVAWKYRLPTMRNVAFLVRMISF